MSNDHDSTPDPSPAQVQALREIYRRLVANDRWPTFDEVDRALDKMGIDLQDIANTFPAGLTNLGHRVLTGRDELILQPESLPFCAPDSDDDRQLILRIIWLAIEADRSYEPGPNEPDTAKLTGDELSQALGYPEARLFHLYQLLTFDYWYGGGGRNPENCTFEFRIRREIRKYRGVQSYADYLHVREDMRKPRAQGSSIPTGISPTLGLTDPVTPSILPVELEADKYDVALSFAGEDRVYVAQVADSLIHAGVAVFYDDYERVNLWGKDLASHLDTIYRKSSRYVVMFVSTHYASKVWTNLERRSALARAIEEKRDYILPARFDDTDLPGVPGTIAYIDCRRTSPEQLAELIVQKISTSTPTASASQHAGTKSRTAAQASDRPEPLITARLEQTPGNRPTSVLIRNMGDGPALDCVYIASLTDSYGLAAWYMTPPIDLDAHEGREITLNAPHGIEQAAFTVHDESSAAPSGQRMRRYFDIYVRAFDDDPRAKNVQWSSTAHIGQPTPPGGLFQPEVSTSISSEERDEAVIYLCSNNHLHRVLPHAQTAPERFDINDSSQPWIGWYLNNARRGTPVPRETSAPKPDARFLRDEPL